MPLKSTPTRGFGLKSVEAAKPRRFTVANTADPVRKPKKPRKPRKTFEQMTEEERGILSLAVATRNYKAKKADVFSHAQEASDKQWGKLSALLGPECSRNTLIDFVAWSNGLYTAQATLNKYERGKVWLSRIYWINAIEMAMHGYNRHFSAIELFAQSCGYEDEFDMMRNDLFG